MYDYSKVSEYVDKFGVDAPNDVNHPKDDPTVNPTTSNK